MTLVLIGIVIGLVLGLTGAGGSVFAVPLLMIFLSLPTQDAMGIALAAVSLSAMYGVLIRWRSRQFYLMPAVLLGTAGVITAPFGKWLATDTPDMVLNGIFSALALFLAARMWRQASQQPERTTVVRAAAPATSDDAGYRCRYSASGQFELRPRCIQGLAFWGAIIGALSGFLGVGGGFLIIPILLYLSEMPIAKAVGTSLLIIAPVSLSGFISYYWLTPDVSVTFLGLIVVGGIAGMAVGTRLANHIAGPHLQKLFAACLIVLIAVDWSVRLL